jgi:hypothetical protein
MQRADASNATRFRAAALAAFAATPPAMVGLNFLRTPLGELGGGHMSPLAAYEPRSDRFLLLDVSRYKYPPVWVTTAVLFESMNTVDSDAGASRGCVAGRVCVWHACAWVIGHLWRLEAVMCHRRWVVVSVPSSLAALPPLPAPPPAVNNTAIRLCLAALPTDDGDAVNACIRGAAPGGAAAAPQPQQACAPAPAPQASGGSASTAWVLVLILAMAVTVLGITLHLERQAAVRAAARGGAVPEGAAMVPL